MSQSAEFRKSPVGRALASAAIFAAFGVAVRFVWGAFDPEMRSWSMVAAAPLMGLVTYLQAVGKPRQLGRFFVGFGILGILFWTVAIAIGTLPVEARIDWFWVAIIYAFPTACIVLGFRELRKSTANTAPTQ